MQEMCRPSSSADRRVRQILRGQLGKVMTKWANSRVYSPDALAAAILLVGRLAGGYCSSSAVTATYELLSWGDNFLDSKGEAV